MIRLILLFTLIILLIPNSLRGNNKVDSLQQILDDIENGYTSNASKASILNQLSTAYADTNYSKSLHYGKEAFKEAKKEESKKEKIRAQENIAQAYYLLSKYDSALIYFESLKEIYEQDDDKHNLANLLLNISNNFHHWSKYNRAKEYAEMALPLFLETDDSIGYAYALRSIGSVYYTWDVYDKAFEYYLKSLEIGYRYEDQDLIEGCCHSLGFIYKTWGWLDESLKYFNEALRIAEVQNDFFQIVNVNLHIGDIYLRQNNYQKALDYYYKAETVEKKINHAKLKSIVLSNIGEAHNLMGDYKQALQYQEKSLKIKNQVGDKKRIAISLYEIGKIHNNLRNYAKALTFLENALKMAKEINLKSQVMLCYQSLCDVYANLKDYKIALEYKNIYTSIKDEIYSKERDKSIADMLTQFETNEKEKEILVHKAEIQKKNAALKRKNLQRNYFILVLVLLGMLSIIMIRAYTQKRKANILLSQQNEKIQFQKREIEQKSGEITKSIQYARRIQQAILPPGDYIQEIIPERFILYKPKDIVSGDFYWVSKSESKIILVAADCTGHGVPGAMMSMLGVSFLNEIMTKNIEKDRKFTLNAAGFLNELREYIIESLHQHKDTDDINEGMDIALCVIDQEKKRMNFSGANNSILISRKGNLMEFKGDKMPISLYPNMKPFHNHEIDIENDDLVYLYTDGFSDQFGGPDGKRLLRKRFKELIGSISAEPMKTQKEILEKEFEEWKKDEDQVDDVLAMGIKVM